MDGYDAREVRSGEFHGLLGNRSAQENRGASGGRRSVAIAQGPDVANRT
jgi:hypothetical protein